MVQSEGLVSQEYISTVFPGWQSIGCVSQMLFPVYQCIALVIQRRLQPSTNAWVWRKQFLQKAVQKWKLGAKFGIAANENERSKCLNLSVLPKFC